MESSDDSAPSSPAQVPGATRRSRRVVNQPKRFGDAPNAPTKRKRGGNHDEEDEEAESPDEEELDDSDEEDEDDGGADEEPAQRTKKSSRKARPRKPAAKKPKINGAGPVTHEHGASLPSRPKKTVRIEVSRDNANWLYGEFRWSGCSESRPLTIAQRLYSVQAIPRTTSLPVGIKNTSRANPRPSWTWSTFSSWPPGAMAV